MCAKLYRARQNYAANKKLPCCAAEVIGFIRIPQCSSRNISDEWLIYEANKQRMFFAFRICFDDSRREPTPRSFDGTENWKQKTKN